MTPDSRTALRLAAAGFFAGAVYHAAGLLRPEWTEPSPPWRHAVFCAINLFVAANLLRPTRPFFLFFAGLTAQQLYSHGTYGWKVWAGEGRVDWASVVVVIALPAVLAAAWRALPRPRLR